MNTASLFPMFLKLEGRNCLVLGAGSVGEQKIRSLLDCGAHIRVVAPSASAAVREWANEELLTWLERPYGSADLDGVFLVVAATSSVEVNHAIYHDARARGILCNECRRRPTALRLLLSRRRAPRTTSDRDFNGGS